MYHDSSFRHRQRVDVAVDEDSVATQDSQVYSSRYKCDRSILVNKLQALTLGSHPAITYSLAALVFMNESLLNSTCRKQMIHNVRGFSTCIDGDLCLRMKDKYVVKKIVWGIQISSQQCSRHHKSLNDSLFIKV